MPDLEDAVGAYLDLIGRSELEKLIWEPIDPDDLDGELAQTGFAVSPSFLPVAAYSHEALVVHTWPGRSLTESPVLRIDRDIPSIRVFCPSVRSLPSALCIDRAVYLKKRSDVIEIAERMVARIPGALPLSDQLREAVLDESSEDEPTTWHPKSGTVTRLAWSAPELEHPFVDVPEVPWDTPADQALREIEAFVASRPGVPELDALLLATQAKASVPRTTARTRAVLAAEAWRQLDMVKHGLWRVRGEGIAEWDATLKQVEDPATMLTGPFAPLIGHPDTYSTRDTEGPRRLVAVADAFGTLGDWEGRLRQLRNAAMRIGSHWGWEEWEDRRLDPECGTLFEAIAEACDRIAPDSVAAAVARRTAQGLKVRYGR